MAVNSTNPEQVERVGLSPLGILTGTTGYQRTMTETKINTDVVYCNYCEAGMSVPVGEVPDDPMCKNCDRVRNPQHTEREIHEIIEEAGVETGDRVRYDGDEWTVESSAWGFTVHLTRVPKESTQEIPSKANEIIREHEVDVRKLTMVDK